MESYKQWRHVFKLDPNKPISDQAIEQICESGTDAVIVGGTDGVTLDNTLHLLSRIRQHVVDCGLEISNLESVTPGFDYYFVPTVLNATKSEWMMGKHHEAVKLFGDTIHWPDVIMEGYCILNGDSKVAKLTKAKTDLSKEDIAAYGLMAEKMFHMPIYYLEYSGIYGQVDTVRLTKQKLSNETRLFYGGGIDNKERAKEMAQYADTIVVGNVIYDNLKEALKTVKAVKG